jgi:lipopolysaccharide export system protein LptA
MEAGAMGHTFHFSGHVKVQSKDLLVHCDTLEVIAEPKGETETPQGSTMSTPAVGTIEKIIAAGHVEITQGIRQAKAGRAEIFSKENRIVLSDNPIVIDTEGTIEGFRIILFQDAEGVQRVSVEGDPTTPAERPRIVLPSMPDIGSIKNKDKPVMPIETDQPLATIPEPIDISEPITPDVLEKSVIGTPAEASTLTNEKVMP